MHNGGRPYNAIDMIWASQYNQHDMGTYMHYKHRCLYLGDKKMVCEDVCKSGPPGGINEEVRHFNTKEKTACIKSSAAVHGQKSAY